METRTVEQVESWNTRSFADGFAGLRELSDGEFSGAVRAGGAWLFMLNGRIIGVYEGSLDDFEDADGTAYAAPHPSLPLLFSMKEKGGETQAKYYTNDTPLSEADSTLSEGSFTGYVELSENVLSGDYYVAYYGGRSMSVAFVGASDQVVTGDEAFERAEDEVGIYEVRDVDLEVTDVPEPDGGDEAAGSAGDASAGGPDVSTAEATTSERSTASGPDSDTPGASGTGVEAGQTTDADATEANAAGATDSGSKDAGAGATGTGADAAGADATQADASATGASASGTGAGASARATDDVEPGQSESSASATPTDASTPPSEATTASTEASASGARTDASGERPDSSDATSDGTTGGEGGPAGAGSAAGEGTTADESDAFSEEAEWREATTIPSLDPDRSEGPDDEGESGQSGATAGSSERAAQTGTATTGQSRTSTDVSAERRSGGRSSGGSGRGSQSSESAPAGASGGGTDEEARTKIRKLRSQLQQRKQQVEQLKERLSNLESERNEYKRERDALRQEVERLEAKLETAGSAGSGTTGRNLDPAQAFGGTNLFVRYESKGEATLEEAAEGEADPEDVNANLRLEHHTQFDADSASVDGRPFDEFLTGSFEYQFVSWVVQRLLYEIRETGHRSALRDLYEAIPRIDRVDLHGSVSAGTEEDDTRQESFDVIVRDRMGNPLFVADLNDGREPTTGDMMGSLVDAASGVAEAHDELSCAFQVTESFFEPEALETADAATSGGFLSREKRESFVKLSRKRGYHLCLVESRSGGFHLNVPEL